MVKLAGRCRDGRRDGVVVAPGREQQRPASLVGGIHLRWRPRGEVRQGGFEQWPARRGHCPAVVQLGWFLLGKHVPEAVPELFRGERYRQLTVGRLAQRDRGDLQRGNREPKHAPDWRSVDRHCGSGEVLAEQPLRDKAAEGVADDDRRRLKPADDPGVVADHIVDALARHLAGVAAARLHRVRVTWPARCCRRVPRLLEQFQPRAPRAGMQPKTMNEYHRPAWLCHFALSFSAWPRCPQNRYLTSSSTPPAPTPCEPFGKAVRGRASTESAAGAGSGRGWAYG